MTPGYANKRSAEHDALQRIGDSACWAGANLKSSCSGGDLTLFDDRGAARQLKIAAHGDSGVPIPKFAHPCGTLSCELRNQRDTSKFTVL